MRLSKIDIEQRMRHYNVSGLSLAIIDRGRIAATQHFGVLEVGTERNVDSHSLFSACSITKFLTSMLAMKLVDQGILDLDEDVNNRLLTWRVPDSELIRDKKVTLRRLLSHQSGIVDPENSFAELDITEGVPSMVELLEGRTDYCSVPIEVKYEPESDFQYSDAGFCVIQQLIEDVTGKRFTSVVNDLIFEPLEMKNTTLDLTMLEVNTGKYSCGHNKNGEVVDGKYPIYPYPAASGLWTTPSDLASLVIELMNSLKGRSQLSQRRAKEMITPQGCKDWIGLGVFLDGLKEKTEISSLGWGIGFQCMMVACPYTETGAVIMTNTDLGVHRLKGIIGEIYGSLS